MARSLHLIANWKMALGVAESVALARAATEHRRTASVQLTLAPSFPALGGVGEVLKRSTAKLGAQDVSPEAPGAHTGEVSLEQLRELGVQYVILGHSERRAAGETHAVVARKVGASLRAGVAPVLCVGETAEERSTNQHVAVVTRQIESAMAGLRPPFGGMPFVIAYEPVWAIGTGTPIEPRQAAEMLAVVKARIEAHVSPPFRAGFSVLYGGSVDAANVGGFLAAGYAGALVGSASWKPETLLPLIDAFGKG